MLVVDLTPSIRLFRLERQNGGWDLRKLGHASLLSVFRLSATRRPVALATGYVQPFNSSSPQARTRSIFVLTQDWSLLCFDASLKLVWETTLVQNVPAWLVHRSAAITVVQRSLRIGDEGLVVVGGRMDTFETAVTTLEHRDGTATASAVRRDEDESNLINNGHDDDIIDGGADGPTPRGTQRVREGDAGLDDLFTAASAANLRHFSYFAVDGATGGLRWKHTTDDFTEDQARHTYQPRSTVVDAGHSAIHAHIGEVPWREYSADVREKALPFRWEHKEDTRLAVEHFEKGRLCRGTHASALDREAVYQLELTGLERMLGVKPHSEDEHIVEPNVVIAHMQGGVEVLHLQTGRTLLQLPLAEGAYGDLNGDGVIDRVQAIVERTRGFAAMRSTRRAGVQLCYGVATSGLPETEKLYNASLCSDSGDDAAGAAMHDMLLAEMGASANKASGEHSIHAAGVLLVPRATEQAAHNVQRDALFFLSSGRVSSIAPSGSLNWAVETGARWGDMAVLGGAREEDDVIDFMRSGAVPAFQSFTPAAWEPQPHVLACGVRVCVLLDASGTMHGEIPLAEPLVARLVMGDVDGDGRNDVILVERDGLRAVVLREALVPSLFTVLFAVLIGAIIVLWTAARWAEHSGKSRKRQ